MKALYLFTIIALIFPFKAYASSWSECKVIAKLESAKKKHHYNITVLKSNYMIGDDALKEKCYPENYIIKGVKIDTDMATGVPATLRNTIYTAMGPNGAISTIEWSKW